MVTLTDPSGNVYRSIVTHSDNDTIFFGQVYDYTGATTSITVGSGWSYYINDRRFGGVWQWDADGGLDGSGDWIVPTGMDTVRRGVPVAQPFKADQTMNLATIVKDWDGGGRLMFDDIICTDMFDEIQRSINALTAIKGSPSWYKNRVAGTPEIWFGSTSLGGGASNFFGTFDDSPCYGGPDPRYLCPASVACPDNPTDNEAVVVYLLQPGSCYWSCPACIDHSGWATDTAGDGALPNGPFIENTYTSEFQYDGTGTLMGGLQGVSQTAESGYLRISGISTLFSPTVDYYNYATASAAGGCTNCTDLVYGPSLGNCGTTCQPCEVSFDAFGQSVNYREWTKFSSGSVDSGGNSVSDKLGDVSEPYTPSPIRPCYDGTSSAVVFDPPAYPYDATKDDGYKVTDQLCIINFSFTYSS